MQVNAMDKNYFKKQSLLEAANHQDFYSELKIEDRNKVFLLLMQAAYGFYGYEWPKMERVLTSTRTHPVK
jgi:hypothetical protein